MPAVRKSLLLPYAAYRLFDVVERVEAYPEFLPWCAGTTVRRDDAGMTATVRIAYKGVRQSFTTRNLHRPPGEIEMTLVDGPFSSLQGWWRFHALAPDACKVEFVLDYRLESGLLGRALAPVFGQITASFVDAFVSRAESLYG